MICNTKSKIDTREIRKFLTVKNRTEQQDKLPLAVLRAKVSIINGPVKLLWVYMQDRGFNSFASNMIKLSVNETKWSSLLARTRALILYISI